MQHEHVRVITRMNDFIRGINWENDVADLDLAKFVMIPREGCSNRPQTRYRVNTGHSKLTDGCHASPALANQWSFHAFEVSSNNRVRVSPPETRRIMHLPLDQYDLTGVPLHRSTLRLDFHNIRF